MRSVTACSKSVAILIVAAQGFLGAFAQDAPTSGPLISFTSLPAPVVRVKTTVVSDSASTKKADLTFRSEIEVVSTGNDADSVEGFQRSAAAREIETSAGTFGDPSRYIQTMAGVAAGNDQRNDFLVRGGNPAENGFVIDNIEIPSINQLALSNTTGGLVSMLDEAAVRQLTLHTDAYDSRFEQRLSAIVEISTRPAGEVERHSEMELGMGGLGGSTTRPFGRDGSLFFSARTSVLQYVTKDIGMNGVPIYRNGFVRAEDRMGDRDTWWGISLTGIDSIAMTPTANDDAETSPFNVSYQGWRNTTGLNWQHLFSARAFAVASIAHAQQSQSILEADQMQNDALVYDEQTSDGFSTFKYDWTFEPNKLVTLTAGTRESFNQVNYSVLQPIGLQNPYSEDPAPQNASALANRFVTFSSAAYGQAAFLLPHSARLVIGDREMQWALGGHTANAGKAVLSMPVFGRLVHVGYAEYAQMPATLFLLSFDNLRTLPPIRSNQLTGGAMLADTRRAKIMLELYQKRYSGYPVAANYPQLSMANIADTFGQAFLMFPMVGSGTGLGRGVELTTETHPVSALDLTATVAYARSWYAGLDNVLRRGNYDIPLSVNLTGVWRITRSLTLSSRYTVTSGRPFTPDDMALSVAQNRDVYDLTQINGVRSSAYRRLDFRFEQTRRLGNGILTWHAGLQNALNNQNFYCEQWEPRSYPAGPAQQNQMPIFPDGGIKYLF
jgi:hypothetical protein